MQICPRCDHRNRDGLLVCEKCGQAFNDLIMPNTRKVATTPDLDADAPATSVMGHVSQPGKLTIQLLEVVEPIVINMRPQIVLGRVGIHTVRRPDVDLSTYNAFRRGVSSLHAAIYYIEQNTYLADMGSLNGTYLNQEGLTPHLRYTLQSGDLIHLGELGLRVYF